MKRTAKRCLYILMICLMVSGTVRAQDNSSGSARVSDLPGPLPEQAVPVYAAPAGPPGGGYFPMTPVEVWFKPRFYVDARGGTLYGYEESFTNVGGFVPYFFEENAMLFADVRGMISYDGRGGANGGVGWRYYMPEIDRFIGFNGWYDFDAGHIEEYNQLGVGFESIGRYFDLIINGYLPVGTRSNMISTYYGPNATFVNNSIYLDRFNEIETAFTGFDANIGGPMPILGRYGLQGYVGFYFFDGSSSTDFTGVSGRLAWQFNEDLNVGVNVTDDHVFGTNTQIQVSMTIPDGKPSRWLRPLSVRDRMMQSVQRNYRVTVEQEYKLVQEQAINPKDNQPYFVVHVDPNTAGDGVVAGTGTVNDPYNLLSQFDNLAPGPKSEVDIIYVHPYNVDPNNPLSASTNLDEGVTLLACQRLLSSSVDHVFMAAQAPGMTFDLPGFSQNGTTQPLPVLTNDAGGNVVTFADGAYKVEVSGFEINSANGFSGIVGVNNRAVNINRNVIQGAVGGSRDITTVNGNTFTVNLADPTARSGQNGIVLTNLSGTAANDEESIIDSNIIRNHVEDGIRVQNSGAAALDLRITNNAPYNIDRDGALEVDTPGLDANDVDTNGNGDIDPAEMLADKPANDSLDGDNDFSNDGIVNNGDDGIDIRADAGSVITVDIRGNGRVGLDSTGNLQFDSPTDTDLNPNAGSVSGLSDPSGDVLGAVDQLDGRGYPDGGIRLNDDNGIELTATAAGTIRGRIIENVIGGGSLLDSAGDITLDQTAAIDSVRFGNGNNGILMTANNATIDFLNLTPFNNPPPMPNEEPVYPDTVTGIRGNVIFGNGQVAPLTPQNPLPNVPPVVNAGDGIRVNATNSTTNLLVNGNAIGSPLAAGIVGTGINQFDPRLGNAERALNFDMTGGTALLVVGSADDPQNPLNPDDPATLNRNVLRYNEIGGVDIVADGNALLSYNIENNEVVNNFTNRANGFSTQLGLTFLIDGNTDAVDANGNRTFQYTFTNSSDAGNLLTDFNWILPTQPGSTLVFDTIGSGSQPFQPVTPTNLPAAANVQASLSTVNGTAVLAGTNPLQDSTGAVIPGGGVADGSNTLNMSFNEDASVGQTFVAGGTFGFQIDADASSNPGAPVLGNQFVGSQVRVDYFIPDQNRRFSRTLTMSAVNGNADAAAATITGAAAVVAFNPIAGQGRGESGISVRTSGTTVANQAVIRDNDVSGFGQNGIAVTTAGLSQTNNLVVTGNRMVFNGRESDVTQGNRTTTGAGLRLERQGSSLLRALVTDNVTGDQVVADNSTGNFGNGVELVASGTAVGGLFVRSSDNTISDNSGYGARVDASGSAIVNWESTDDYLSDNGRIVTLADGSTASFFSDNVNIQANENSNVFTTFNNVRADRNLAGSGLVATALGTSVLNIDVNSMGSAQTPSSFSNNAINGIQVATQDNALGIVDLDQIRANDNATDGLNFNRSGASLLLVNVTNSTVAGNDDDGLQFNTSGSGRNDASTPLYNAGTQLAPANRLVLNNVNLIGNGVVGAENGGNGMELATFGSSVLVTKVRNTRITDSATDGVRAFSTGLSSLGEVADRAVFDNVTITDNGRDGIKLFAMGAFSSKSNMFVEVNSTLGNTLIAGNGDDGIEAAVPFGAIDLNVVGTNGSLIIQQNANNGIEFNVADVAIDGDDAGDLPLASNNGERVDGDADGAENEILNFFFPNGFEFSDISGYNGMGTLNVANAIIGDENLNDGIDRGNGNDGIQIFNSNVWNFVGGGNDQIGVAATFAGPTTDSQGNALNNLAAANQHDVNRDLIVDGAFGVGNLRQLNGQVPNVNFIQDQAGIMVLTVDNTSLAGNGQDGLNIISDGNNDTFDPGNLVSATVTDSQIVSNGRNGVNIDLEGKHGSYVTTFTPGGTYSVNTANQFIFDNNNISNNNNYGMRYQANAGVMRRFNFGLAADTYFWSEQFQDGVQPTPTPGLFSPTFIRDNTAISSIFNTNIGTADGLTSLYYSIATDLNSRLTFTNNTVTSNGQPNQLFNEGGDGLFIRVSTNSYLSADIGGAAGSGNGNLFSGNAIADVRMESFTAAWVNGLTSPVPNASTAATGATLDQLFLDDTAQMTLRFNNNQGNQLDADLIIDLDPQTIGQRAAAYRLNGTAFIGALNNPPRLTQMFQVDDGNNLDTNNTFGNNLSTEFANGGWYLVPVADPAFPNPAFPENINEDFGDPFFP